MKEKMFSIRVIVLFLVFASNCGFLLEDKIPPQSSTNNQYLSVSKYLADQTSIHHELEILRRQQDMTMNLLTSQLKQKLAEMETQISEKTSRNETCKVEVVEELEQNYLKVKQNNTSLASDLEALQIKYNILNESFKNTTTELKSSLREFKQLKNIQQLQSLNNLNEKIQKIDSSVTSLRSHEQARNQDFLALYNLTVQSEAVMNRKMNQYQTDLQNVDKEMNNTNTELQRVSIQMNQYRTDLQNVDKLINNTITELQRNVSNKVAFTGCVAPLTILSAGATIKFTDLVTNIGNNNLNSLHSTGQFVCTVSGLYHISVVLMLSSKNHEIHILKNNQTVVSGWMADYYRQGTKTYWHSVPAVVASWLEVGDTVSVNSEAETVIEEFRTACLTIVRLT